MLPLDEYDQIGALEGALVEEFVVVIKRLEWTGLASKLERAPQSSTALEDTYALTQDGVLKIYVTMES